MNGWQRILTGLSLLTLITGCSHQPQPAPTEHSGYCLRAGQQQSFDCSAPALAVNEVRDPLLPRTRFTDEELFSLLAEVKLWLKREHLIAAGKPIPPELLPKTPQLPPDSAAAPEKPLWPQILESLFR